MSILPIITPPFVIALALVVLFGRTGLITGWLDARVRHPALALDLRPAGRDARAAPVVLADRVHDPARRARGGEPRARGSGADAARVARARVPHGDVAAACGPALANAFLLGFVESLADFGNPIVLAGNFEVLSTKIFFAIAGAQHDPGRAAVLASVLLGFTIVAFWLQQRWLGRLSYVTVSGKGDGGMPAQAAARAVVLVLRHRRRVDPLHGRLLRRHPRSAASSRTSAAAT